MNWFIIIAGLVATATTVGHFAVGSRGFLKPMLGSSFDVIPKKAMHCVFHYVSVYLILSAVALLLIGFNLWSGPDSAGVVKFIGANYLGFALWQITLAISSGIPRALFRLFQWIFFATIAVFSFLGTCL